MYSFYPQQAHFSNASAIIADHLQTELWVLGDNSSAQFTNGVSGLRRDHFQLPKIIKPMIPGLRRINAVYAAEISTGAGETSKALFLIVAISGNANPQLWASGDLSVYQLKDERNQLLERCPQFTLINVGHGALPLAFKDFAIHDGRLMLLDESGKLHANYAAMTAYDLGKISAEMHRATPTNFYPIIIPPSLLQAKKIQQVCLTANYLLVATEKGYVYAKSVAGSRLPLPATRVGICTIDGWCEVFTPFAGDQKTKRMLANDAMAWLQFSDGTVFSVFDERKIDFRGASAELMTAAGMQCASSEEEEHIVDSQAAADRVVIQQKDGCLLLNELAIRHYVPEAQIARYVLLTDESSSPREKFFQFPTARITGFYLGADYLLIRLPTQDIEILTRLDESNLCQQLSCQVVQAASPQNCRIPFSELSRFHELIDKQRMTCTHFAMSNTSVIWLTRQHSVAGIGPDAAHLLLDAGLVLPATGIISNNRFFGLLGGSDRIVDLFVNDNHIWILVDSSRIIKSEQRDLQVRARVPEEAVPQRVVYIAGNFTRGSHLEGIGLTADKREKFFHKRLLKPELVAASPSAARAAASSAPGSVASSPARPSSRGAASAPGTPARGVVPVGRSVTGLPIDNSEV